MDTNETTIYTAILITGIVIGTIFIYFTITIYRNHRKHFRLLRRQFVAEMDLLERERSRIASDLHDELGPILAVTKIHIRATTPTTKEQEVHLSTAEKNIELLTDRFDGIAKNLTPKALVTKGLKTALDDFIEQIHDVTPLRIEMEYKVTSTLATFHALPIYRIIQELIHNTVKHSKASTAQIVFAERRRRLYILYKDNGIGMVKHPDNNSTGIGMNSIRNRTEMLGGKLNIATIPTTGIDYFFEIPLQPQYERSDKSSHS